MDTNILAFVYIVLMAELQSDASEVGLNAEVCVEVISETLC